MCIRDSCFAFFWLPVLATDEGAGALARAAEVPVLLMRAAEAVVPPAAGAGAARAGDRLADLQYGRIDEILATGLHAFLTQFLDRVNDLGGGISRDFLVTSGD